MSTYIINFTDPLATDAFGFTIAPGGFNGPGGANANTTLRLYGRGALEWGEAVDENLVRLAENFAGATPPLNPVFGQIWLQQRLYVQNTSIVLTNGVNAPTNAFHRYSFDDDNWYTSGEAPYPFEVFVDTSLPVSPSLGDYVFLHTGGGNGTLYRWDSPYAQAAPQWMERYRTSDTSNPVDGTTKPKQSLLMWQPSTVAGGGEWSGPAVTTVAASSPSDPSVGMLWWDSINDKLYVWDGSAWQAVLVSGVPAGGDLNMNTFSILNLDDGFFVGTAATIDYVDSLASATTLNATYLRLDGGNVPSADVSWNGNNITNLPVPGYPSANTTYAASIGYVNNLATTIGAPGGGGFASIHTSGGVVAHKVGDIYVFGGRIWIAVTASSSVPPLGGGSDGNWKQVFPAQYS